MALGLAVRELARAEELLAARSAQLLQAEADARHLRAEGIGSDLYAAMFQGLRQVEARLRLAQEEVRQCRSRLEDARRAWIDARRDEQVLDRLRRRREEAHRLERLRTEQVGMEEQAAASRARRSESVV